MPRYLVTGQQDQYSSVYTITDLEAENRDAAYTELMRQAGNGEMQLDGATIINFIEVVPDEDDSIFSLDYTVKFSEEEEGEDE